MLSFNGVREKIKHESFEEIHIFHMMQKKSVQLFASKDCTMSIFANPTSYYRS